VIEGKTLYQEFEDEVLHVGVAVQGLELPPRPILRQDFSGDRLTVSAATGQIAQQLTRCRLSGLDLGQSLHRLQDLVKFLEAVLATRDGLGSIFRNQFQPKFTKKPNLEPILRLLNLQQQRQRCSRLERFFTVE
jgi:hypothetical protein